MTDLMIGKGVSISEPRRIAGGDPEAIAEALHAAHVQTAAIRVCDGSKVIGRLEALFTALRQQGIQAGAWGTSHMHRASSREAKAVLEACRRYRPAFYLISLDSSFKGNYAGTRKFLATLRPGLEGLPLGMTVAHKDSRRPSHPWAEFPGKIDFVCPLVNASGADPLGDLIAAQQLHTSLASDPHVPMSVIATDLLAARRPALSAGQLVEFLSAARADPFLQGVLISLHAPAKVERDLWDAFSQYEWDSDGREIPTQPLGWAKVKAADGLWIRSSPRGEMIGGLAKGELTPIWAVTDTRWAALNQATDRWVFIGDPDQVGTTLGLTSEAPLPSTGLELYQARVATPRGLNVRDAVRGRVLRSLPFNAIVRVYEDNEGWARITPAQGEWVCAAFLSRLMV